MNFKKILGIACIIIGAICLFFSDSIAKQVIAGQAQINSGQSKVNSVNSLFSTNPVSKEMGKQITSPYQQEINAGQAEITYYSALSKKLQIGGIILVVLGIAILVFWRDKKRR